MLLCYNSKNYISIVLAVLSLRDGVNSAIKLTNPIREEITANVPWEETDLTKDMSGITSGANFKKAFATVYGEFNKAFDAEPIDKYLAYETKKNPSQLSLSEEEGHGEVAKTPDLKANAKMLLSHQPEANQEAIMKAGDEKTAAYSKLLSEANEAGNYGFVLNGEGPDMPSTAAFISVLKQPPQGILIRPKNEKTIADVPAFNQALQEMQHDPKYGNVKNPKALLVTDELYEEFAKKIEKRIAETGKPFHLVVFGSGEPILKLASREELKELKDEIIYSHLTPYFWQEDKLSEGGIRWMLGSNVSKRPEFEKEILDLGVQRLAIHAAASRLEHFSNILDKDEAGLQLVSSPDVNLHHSGAVAGMKAYFSSDSHSEVGRNLGLAMKPAFQHNSQSEITEQRIARIGKNYFKSMSDKQRKRAAVNEVLMTAFRAHLENNPKLEYQKFGSPELESMVFWSGHQEELEAACAKFPAYVKKDGTIPDTSTFSRRELAFWTYHKPYMYTGMRFHRQLMVPLIALAENDKKLSVHIHANEAQAIVTATEKGSEKTKVPFYALPVSFGPRNPTKLTRENFNMKLDPRGSTLVVTGVEQRKLLKAHEELYARPADNIPS